MARRPAAPARHPHPAADPARGFHQHLQRRTAAPSLPHRGTPATAYAARPKATPGDRTSDAHYRVRTDVISTSGAVTVRTGGKLYHVGIGRIHAGTAVLLLITDLHIRIINAATGQQLRELTLDPTRNYQPTGAPKGPTRGAPQQIPRTLKQVRGHSYVLRDDTVGTAGFEPPTP